MSYNPNTGIPPTRKEIQECIQTEYSKDYRAIENTKFKSTTDRLIALKAAKDSTDLTNEILKKEESDKGLLSTTKEVRDAHDICWQLARTMLWNAFNGIRNMVLRRQYIEKIGSLAQERLNELYNIEKALPLNLEEVLDFSMNVSEERNAALEITRARISPSSASFSKMLKEEGVRYDQLLDKYSERTYKKSFERLDEFEKNDVYIQIIKASGRSNKIVNIVSKLSGSLGIILIGFMLATTIWDITESANPVGEAIKDVFVITLSCGAAFTGEQIGTAVTSSVAVFLGASDAVAAGTAWIGGITAGAVLSFTTALVVEGLFELIFKALTLNIPPELMKSTFTPIYVPLSSPLYERLSA